MLAEGGPSRRKRNFTGTGTSSTESSRTASCSLTKAMEGWSRNPTLPAGAVKEPNNLNEDVTIHGANSAFLKRNVEIVSFHFCDLLFLT